MSYIAKTFQGVEELLRDELTALGATNTQIIKRGVSFEGDLSTFYRIVYCSRLSLRILKPLFHFKARNDKQLYDRITQYAWHDLINVDQTFAIDHAIKSHFFRHSKYAALKMKDGVVDQIRRKKGARPSIQTDHPDIRLNLHIHKDQVNISLDASGYSLHRRGYRISGHIAPLNEVLAATLIKITNWSGDRLLLDPMCGSGTIGLEAAYAYCNFPSAYLNDKFCFQQWADYDHTIWQNVRSESDAKINIRELPIQLSDKDHSSIMYVMKACRNIDPTLNIPYQTKDFFKLEKPSDQGIIIMNPPYGERIEQRNITAFYKGIGDHLKQEFSGWDAWIFSSNKEALKAFGLRSSKKVTLFNGPLECKFQKFELYKGSRKNEH